MVSFLSEAGTVLFAPLNNTPNSAGFAGEAPINGTESEVRFENLDNELLAIEVIVLGKFNSVRFVVTLLNVEVVIVPIFVSVNFRNEEVNSEAKPLDISGIETSDGLQPEKAELPTFVTLFGTVMEVKAVQL